MIKQVSDEVGETLKDTAKSVALEVKKQVLPPKDKKDPVTGKPVPSKKALTQLNQAVAQLQQAKLKKIREELEKQRLPSAAPEKKQEELEAKKKSFDVIAQTLKNAESTGEFGRQVGG